jgi:anthranilate 1,2-dioxygenase (deaminating, decarboxylating) large subunit
MRGLPATDAYDLPPVNLGFTSFLDGGPPAGPGFYFQQYFQYYNSDTFKDKDGKTNLFPKSAFPNPNLNAYVGLSQFLYQSNQPVLFGGKWGLDLIVPVVGFDLTGVPLEENDPGIGDLLVGPYIQWDPVMGSNGPVFMHRIELQATFPTGRYDKNKALNPGSNFYTFNPYWAGTFFLSPQWTASARIHYLWNSVNDDTKTQAGQAIHLNYATDYELIPHMLRAGVNGYYLKQITDTKNPSVPGREQVFAIGPGLLFSFSQNNHLFFNAFFEMAAENRTQGNRFNFRWTHHF